MACAGTHRNEASRPFGHAADSIRGGAETSQRTVSSQQHGMREPAGRLNVAASEVGLRGKLGSPRGKVRLSRCRGGKREHQADALQDWGVGRHHGSIRPDVGPIGI